MITVVNKRSHIATPNDVYIGRPSVLGNPYVIDEHGDRAEVIAMYEQWLQDQLKLRSRVWAALADIYRAHKAGKQVNLVCWCKPACCHGDILEKVITGK